jgi:hypothetical protein
VLRADDTERAAHEDRLRGIAAKAGIVLWPIDPSMLGPAA